MSLDSARCRSSFLLAVWLVCAMPACSSGQDAGTSLGAGGSGGSSGGDCTQAASMLDVSKAPGAGPSYPAPMLSASWTKNA